MIPLFLKGLDPKLIEPLASVAAGVFGLLSTVIGFLLSEYKARNADARRLAAIDTASKKLAFVRLRIQVEKQLVLEPPHDVVERFRKDADEVDNSLKVALGALASRASGKDWWQRVFLFYSPKKSMAWIPRALFYLSLFFLLDIGLVAVVSPEERDRGMLASSIVLFILAFVFRTLAVVLD